MRKILLIFFYFGFSGASFSQQKNVFVVNEKTVSSNLDGCIFSAKNLKFNEEKEIGTLKNQFKKVEESVANFGLNNDENWIYFDIKNENPENKNFVLYLDQPFLEKAHFYQFFDDSLVAKIELNQNVLLENRPLSYPNFVYPFQLKHNQNNSIFLRIKASKINGISRALIHLSDENTFHKNFRRTFFTFGVLVGFLLLTFFAGLILYYFGRKKIYFIYSIYILSVLFFYLSNGGYLNAIFANTLMGSPQFEGAILMLNTALHLYFIEQFLQLKTQFSKKFQYLIFGVIGISLLLAIFYLFLPNLSFLPYFIRILLFFVGILIVFLAIWGLRKKQKNTHLYSFATFPSIILIFYFLLSALKFLPLFPLAFSFAFPCTVFEIIVFGMGLVYQFNEEKNAIERKLNEERSVVAAKIISTQEHERQRISQDLHDDLGSTLSMLKFRLEESNKRLDNQLVNEISVADKAVDDLRLISYNLMPTMFRERGLVISLNEFILLNKIESNVEFLHSGNERRLDFNVELSIYRIAKELLNNAQKHAKASKIEVQLIYFENFLYLSVEDNGIGIKENQAELKGNGLKNINLRVNYLNGKMNQETSEKGTLISIEIPYEPNPKDKNSTH